MIDVTGGMGGTQKRRGHWLQVKYRALPRIQGKAPSRARCWSATSRGVAPHQLLGHQRPQSSGQAHRSFVLCLSTTRSLQPFHTTWTFVWSFSGCEIENFTAHLAGAVSQNSRLWRQLRTVSPVIRLLYITYCHRHLDGYLHLGLATAVKAPTKSITNT